MIALKNSTESFSNRLSHAKERISYLGDRTFEIIQLEDQKEKI